MEDDKVGVLIDEKFNRNLSWKEEMSNLWMFFRGTVRAVLPLKSRVVRFGWIVILYLVGCAKDGNLILFHGKT